MSRVIHADGKKFNPVAMRSCPTCHGVQREDEEHRCLGGNPYRDQDGTATNVGSVFTSTVAAELVKTICDVLGIKRESPPEVIVATVREHVEKLSRWPAGAMTDAERKLVERCLEVYDECYAGAPPDEACTWLNSINEKAFGVAAERKPPKPRPITPEELAMVEAAKQLAPLLKEARDSGTPVDGLYGAKQLLIEFVARLK